MQPNHIFHIDMVGKVVYPKQIQGIHPEGGTIMKRGTRTLLGTVLAASMRFHLHPSAQQRKVMQQTRS